MYIIYINRRPLILMKAPVKVLTMVNKPYRVVLFLVMQNYATTLTYVKQPFKAFLPISLPGCIIKPL